MIRRTWIAGLIWQGMPPAGLKSRPQHLNNRAYLSGCKTARGDDSDENPLSAARPCEKLVHLIDLSAHVCLLPLHVVDFLLKPNHAVPRILYGIQARGRSMRRRQHCAVPLAGAYLACPMMSSG